MRPLRFLLLAASFIAVALLATALWQRERIAAIWENWDIIREGAEEAPAADSAEKLAAWIRRHPEQVAFASWTPGREDEALLHRADEVVGIASTVKILVLAEYARQVTEGRLDPDEAVPLAAWEALHLPGTDGGTHRRAVEVLRERGALQNDTAHLREVAWAMTVHSDNAATDFLLHRLGREQVESTAAWLGLAEPGPKPLGGALILARSPPEGSLPAAWMAQWAQRPDRELRDEVWRLSQRLADDPAFAQAQRASLEEDGIGLNLAEQMTYAKTLGPTGTARGYAALMAKVLTKAPGEAWAKVMAENLEWPLLRSEPLRAEFHRYGTKGGSLPGVLTASYFAAPKDGEPRVLSLFFGELPLALWGQLMRKYTQQDLERQLLADPALAEGLLQSNKP